MVIKKHTNQTSPKTNLSTRLNNYTRQGKSYRSTRKQGSGTSMNFVKGSLAALIPLAAASSINAQCIGPVNNGNPVTLPQNGQYTFNLDAASIAQARIQHFYVPGFGITMINLTNVANMAFRANLDSVLNIAGTVTNGQSGFVTSPKRLCAYIGGVTGGQHCPGFTGFIPIKRLNHAPQLPGWIKLNVISLNSTGVQFQILERGYESVANPNNNLAQVDDCSDGAKGLAASLPVELTYFRTTPADQKINLEWATASELNNAGFEVQRSVDGFSFAKIGWVNGHGTTTVAQQYVFSDNQVQPNTTYYYRLKQMDMDGSGEFTPVRTAMIEDANAINIGPLFPNPVSREYGFSMFQLNVPEEGQLTIQVYDNRGGLVKELTKFYPSGRSTLSVPVSDLANGQYIVKLQLDREVQYRKMVVK